MSLSVRTALFIALVSVACASASIQCIGENNKPVDWWFVYKLPSLNNDDKTERGFAYAYMDSEGSKIEMQPHTLDDITGNALGDTLHQIYTNKKSSSVAWMLYNDQPPKGKFSLSRGHAKGGVGFDKETGFWLVHSTPHFPDLDATKFDFPEREHVYGQTFICITISADKMEGVAEQISYYFPGVYASNLPSSLSQMAPTLKELIDGQHTKEPDNRTVLKTLGGVSFTSYAKSTAAGVDLWGEIIAENEKMDMYVQTWRRSPFYPAFCKSKYKQDTMNINSIKLGDVEWNYTEDHSKWGVGTSGTLVCVGDINRMPSQTKRGGGALCVHNSKFHSEMMKLINESDECKKESLRGSEEQVV